MGRKHTGTGKYIYFCIASLIFLSSISCVTTYKIEKENETRAHLLKGQKHLSDGNYGKSLNEYGKALSLSGKGPPGDEALFNMGLVSAHYGNPEKDYKESLGFFKKLIKDYPLSPLVEQAKIWISVLEIIEKTKQVDIEIEKKKKKLD